MKIQCVPSPSQSAEARKRVSKMCIVMRWLRNFHTFLHLSTHTHRHTHTLTPCRSLGIALLPSLSQISRERRAFLLKLMPRAVVSLIFSLAQTGPPIHWAVKEHGWEGVHVRGTLFFLHVPIVFLTGSTLVRCWCCVHNIYTQSLFYLICFFTVSHFVKSF